MIILCVYIYEMAWLSKHATSCELCHLLNLYCDLWLVKFQRTYLQSSSLAMRMVSTQRPEPQPAFDLETHQTEHRKRTRFRGCVTRSRDCRATQRLPRSSTPRCPKSTQSISEYAISFRVCVILLSPLCRTGYATWIGFDIYYMQHPRERTR